MFLRAVAEYEQNVSYFATTFLGDSIMTSTVRIVMLGCLVGLSTFGLVGCGSGTKKADKMGTDKMGAGKMDGDKMGGDKMGAGKMNGDKMGTGKMDKQ